MNKETELVVLKWSEISIHTTNEAIEPISNILHEAGASGVVIEDPFELVKNGKINSAKSTNSIQKITLKKASLLKLIYRLIAF